MQPFNEYSICWKCGSNQAEAVYCAAPRAQRVCWRNSSIGLTQEHIHRQCLRCGHVWFEAVRPVEEIAQQADDRATDAELGALVRLMVRSGMALYRTEHLNWTVRVWNKSKGMWVSLPHSGDSPEEVLRRAFADLSEREIGHLRLVEPSSERHLA